MTSKAPYDYKLRPFEVSFERRFTASVEQVYNAWTSNFDLWFAQPGEIMMTPQVDKPWFFYNRHDWGRHALSKK